MKRTILSLILLPALLLAQEAEPLLARLEKETRDLAAVAREAVVSVTVRQAAKHAGQARLLWAPGQKDPIVVQPDGALARVAADLTVHGVLAGQPARVIVAYASVGKANTVTVTLAGGREVEAQRIDGDPELGVAVFTLPDEAARNVKGLAVESDWTKLTAGSLAVATGAPPAEANARWDVRLKVPEAASVPSLFNLTLVRGAEVRLGTVEAAGDAAVLLGTHKTLLGLRGTKADFTSCTVCHVGDAKAVGGRVPGHVQVGEFHDAFRVYRATTARLAAGRLEAADSYIAGPVIHRVLDDLDKHGRIRHGYLGVVLGDTVGQGKEAGVLITSVLDGSPAQAAGLAAGQRVAAVDGLACPSTTTLSRALLLHRPGETVTLTLAPDGKEVRIELADRAAAQKHFVTAETLGLECADLGPELRRWLKLDDSVRGVVVDLVRPKSPASAAGLRRGDVITWGGGGEVAGQGELDAALAGAKGNVVLRGLRDGNPFTATLRAGGEQEAPR